MTFPLRRRRPPVQSRHGSPSASEACKANPPPQPLLQGYSNESQCARAFRPSLRLDASEMRDLTEMLSDYGAKEKERAQKAAAPALQLVSTLLGLSSQT